MNLFWFWSEMICPTEYFHTGNEPSQQQHDSLQNRVVYVIFVSKDAKNGENLKLLNLNLSTAFVVSDIRYSVSVNYMFPPTAVLWDGHSGILKGFNRSPRVGGDGEKDLDCTLCAPHRICNSHTSTFLNALFSPLSPWSKWPFEIHGLQRVIHKRSSAVLEEKKNSSLVNKWLFRSITISVEKNIEDCFLCVSQHKCLLFIYFKLYICCFECGGYLQWRFCLFGWVLMSLFFVHYVFPTLEHFTRLTVF